jgi:carboxylesterase type B
MAPPQIRHEALQATFTGVETTYDGTPVHHFRGIKYANIPARFERATPVEGFQGREVDCSQYGYVYFPQHLRSRDLNCNGLIFTC